MFNLLLFSNFTGTFNSRSILRVIKQKHWLCFLFLLFFTSCEDKNPLTQTNEQKEALKLLQDYGFSIKSEVTPTKPKQSYPVMEIKTKEEARKLIRSIEEFKKGGVFRADLIMSNDSRNGRLSLYACDDPGAYYIQRAVQGLLSHINIRFERDHSSNINNISSTVIGFPFYGYDQYGVVVFNPHDEFCIDFKITWGADLGALPTALHLDGYIHVKLYGPDSCNAMVQWGYGHC